MSLEEMARKETKSKNRFPGIWFDEAKATEFAPYLVKGLIDARSVVLVFGPSGQGKTFFAIDLVCHIATGIPWRGRRVNGGLVVYVAAEAGISIARRFSAWDSEKLAESREDRVPLKILTRGANLLDDTDTASLMDELREIAGKAPLALVVFDTLSRSIPGGDENTAQDMTAVVGIADRIREEFQAATMFVHHSGKDADKGPRGSSTLEAAADTSIQVNEGVATVRKVRDGMAGETFGFSLGVVNVGTDQDGDSVTTCVAWPQEVTRKPTKAKLSGAAQTALMALREAISENGQPMPDTSSIPKGVRAVTLERWRQQFKLRYGNDSNGDTTRRAFDRAKEQLLSHERIRVSDPYVWMT